MNNLREYSSLDRGNSNLSTCLNENNNISSNLYHQTKPNEKMKVLYQSLTNMDFLDDGHLVSDASGINVKSGLNGHLNQVCSTPVNRQAKIYMIKKV